MRFSESAGDLAAARRRKLFDSLGDDVDVVVALTPANKTYLTGYHSMTHDVAPAYRSAAVATRDRVILVASSADAGPAHEMLGEEVSIHRYGTFFFETAEGMSGHTADGPCFVSFDEALAAAIAATGHAGSVITVDQSENPGIRATKRTRLRDASAAFTAVRATKLAGEIERMRRATELAQAGIENVVAQARIGTSEWEMAAMIGAAMASGGAVARFVVVTSGARSALADAYPSHRRVEAGDLVRIDIGCSVDGYWTDIARTLVVGEPSAKVVKRYEAIKAGLFAELNALRAGVRAGHVFDAAIATVRNAGIPNYRRHHCGHGIGIEGYEYPLIAPGNDALLEAGMCVCVETPFYEIGWGGMMIEDLVVIEDDGYRPLTTLDHSLITIDV